MYTAVIAARPGEPMVTDALASIYAQTRPPHEVRIVTDAMVAPDIAWTNEIARRFPGVCFTTQPRTGLANALSHAIGHIQTPYVAFLDSDDLWEPEKQERQLDILDTNMAIDAVTCLAVNEWPTTSGWRQSAPAPSAMFTCTTFRRETFARYGLPDGTASHFTWLYRWWADARGNGIAVQSIPYLGLRRRIHGGNTWVVDNAEAHRDLMFELRRIIGRKETSTP